ncbi:glycoside hydrolase family 3 N-terminal domain-containing protein [Microbacterium kribbense]|uniref:Glycoside hydrolase family 3 N-terminal domain-containing protein n=1 Tax=Microbacterium kribbense TaxID=433645 RepID=A0ABP7GSU1_9MICO
MSEIPAFPEVSQRVRALHARMTLDEKLAQLVGYWLDQNGTVAPMQSEMAAGQRDAGALADVTKDGIGHYTRVYGTRPVDPLERAAWLWQEQRRLKRDTRLGIPALVHEECLTGLAAWQAAVFPTPLAWGAAFDPDLVREMAQAIGESMRALGVHQGLAPVLDVIVDPRWGRVDECIGEDPYLVGTIGTGYVQGLQSAGVHATLKHFVGYSASQSGRNHAPVHAGPREMADVFVAPFEMVVAEAHPASVMNAYTALDGVPMAADPEYLTTLLHERLGFDGVVVADYFSVAFLQVMQSVATDRGHAAALALQAGVDVELPTGDAYLAPLRARVRQGGIDERYVDRAVLRVLRQKEQLGLLDADAYEDDPPAHIDLDSPRHRELARALAQESVVLLANDGTLPLQLPAQRIAVIGPNADRSEALQGCYSFANHVLAHHPGVPVQVRIPTVAEALREAGARLTVTRGCAVDDDDTTGFAEAVAAAQAADVAVVVVGDQAGLFGRGSVGEGNDVDSLELPGVQRALVEAIVATGTPVVMVLLTGRPYVLDWALDAPGPRPRAVLQSFFPGEEGGSAIADILGGDLAPSGRLPISLPRSSGAQPYSYLHPILGGDSEITAARSTPVRPFGFGLSYTGFDYTDLAVAARCAAGDEFDAEVTVTNTGSCDADDVVQLYGHDMQASVTRPVAQLLGFARVHLAAGASTRVRFRVPTTRFAFSDRRMVKIVEPGDVQVWVGAHAAASAPAARDDAGFRAVSDAPGPQVSPGVTGAATERAVVSITGPLHEVTGADARTVAWEQVAAVRV